MAGRDPHLVGLPHLVWGAVRPSCPEPTGGGWHLELEEYLREPEPGGEDVYREYPIRLLVAGVSDEVYERMVEGGSHLCGIVPRLSSRGASIGT